MIFHLKPYRIKCACQYLSTVVKQNRSNGQRLVSVCTNTPPANQEKRQSWTSHNVRNTFIDFFCNKHGHLFVPSSSVIPPKDQGTLFTNAGMNQFRKIFEGTVDPQSHLAQYKKVTNSQKCIRVGGKHNDLDEVGKDVYHHTYFEMLGNWSFGDYFKAEACKMALELLTDVYNIPLDRLYFTYFQGDASMGVLPDLEVKEIWLSLGIPESRILPFGIKDNFWEMGDTGPCGPCTEIHYNYSGKPDVGHLVNLGSPEMMEIWNLVFTQFDRKQDGTLEKLPQCHVDTGMGLERILAILQGVKSNYDTDLFVPIFQQIQQVSDCRPYSGLVGTEDKDGLDTAYRIVADHIRMLTVCIADGVLPSKRKLGYAVRKVLYRCIHQARMLGVPPGQLATLVDIVTESLGEAYPEIAKNGSKIRDVLIQSEEWFTKFMEEGKTTFVKFLNSRKGSGNLTGIEIANLIDGKYDGTSVPLDVIENLASLHDLDLNLEDYHEIIKARNVTQTLDDTIKPDAISADIISTLNQSGVPYTNDHYIYDYTAQNGVYNFSEGNFEASVVGLVSDGKLVENVTKGDNCGILLDKTCFYSVGGGQLPDVGKIHGDNGSFDVTSVQKCQNYVVHVGTVEDGQIQIGNKLSLHFNEDHRLDCMRNHTATHLLNASLRDLFGNVQQLGSYIGPNKLAFRFSCHVPLTTVHLDVIQNNIINIIQAKLPVTRVLTTAAEVMKKDHIISLPNEMVSNEVSVVHVNEIDGVDHRDSLLSSSEVCGGIHVKNTSDLESFCIIKLNRGGMNDNRMACVTGSKAKQAYLNGEKVTDLYNNLVEELPSCADILYIKRKISEINKALAAELIPIQVQKNIAEKMNDINVKKHEVKLVKQEIESIKQEVVAAVKSSSSIHLLNFKNPKSVKKILLKLKVNNPAIFLSETENRTVGIVHFPQKENDSVVKLVERIKLLVPEAELQRHSTNEKDFHYVIVKNSKCANVLHTEFSQILKEIE